MDNKKINIYLFYAIALFQGMVFYGPIATLYRQAHGLSVFDITLIESISLILLVILEVPWGYAADKIGYKKTIIICCILYFISKIVFWRADSFFLFLLERLILSVVLSGISGCDSAYLYLSAEKDKSQKIFGIYEAMGTAGLIIASIVYSTIIKNNYGLSSFLTVITYGIAMIISLFLKEVKNKKAEHEKFSDGVNTIFLSFKQNKQFIIFLIAAALLSESNQTITVFLNQLQYLRSGIQPQYMGYIYVLVTVSGLLSAFAHKYTAFFGEAAGIRILYFTAAAACFAMMLFSNPFISILGIVLLRVSASVFVPIQMDIQNRQVKISDRATMLSIYSIIMNSVAVGTNLIFGKMADISVSYAMLAGAVFCFTGLIFYVIWNRKTMGGCL